MENDTTIEYFADEYYSIENDRTVCCTDPTVNIDWGFENLILSKKDVEVPLLKDSDCNF